MMTTKGDDKGKEELLDLEAAHNWRRCTSAGVSGDSEATQTSFHPQGRYGHTAVLTPEAIAVFGGSSADGVFCHDLVRWELREVGWQEPLEAQMGREGGRNFHSACWAQGAVWVTCGKANGYRNDVQQWRDDAKGWQVVEPADAKARVPDGRWGQASVVVDGEERWLIHGGYDCDAAYAEDLWAWHFAQRTWTRMEQSGTKPGARQHHTMALLDGVVYMWGGKSNGGACDTIMYTLDPLSGQWSHARANKTGARRLFSRGGKKTRQSTPAPRWGHTMTAVKREHDAMLLVFGGRDAEQVFNDAWVYHTATGEWEQWDAAFAPEPRAFHSATLFSGRLHIFGGRNLTEPASGALYKIDLTKECLIRMVPADVMRMIIGWLDPPDVLSLCQVSRHFNELASDDRVRDGEQGRWMLN